VNEESRLIARIARAIPSRPGGPRGGGLLVGVGDDAAVFRPRPGRDLVLSSDSFLEGVHFLADVHPPESAGYKSLVRAASDLAAMGAEPRFFLLNLALPARRTGKWLDAFLVGMARAARRCRLVLAGGDTSRHPTVAVSITVLGEMKASLVLTRSAARPGDRIYLSGVPGRAQLGLELIRRGLHRKSEWKPLVRPHLFPEPRLALGAWLARHRLASSMIDTSDGLSTDLSHLCESSRVGAVLWRDKIPRPQVPTELRRRGPNPELNPEFLALHGGEDYELLFTVPRPRAGKIPPQFQGVPLTAIGEITRRRRLRILDLSGRVTLLQPRGWDHFEK